MLPTSKPRGFVWSKVSSASSLYHRILCFARIIWSRSVLRNKISIVPRTGKKIKKVSTSAFFSKRNRLIGLKICTSRFYNIFFLNLLSSHFILYRRVSSNFLIPESKDWGVLISGNVPVRREESNSAGHTDFVRITDFLIQKEMKFSRRRRLLVAPLIAATQDWWKARWVSRSYLAQALSQLGILLWCDRLVRRSIP